MKKVLKWIGLVVGGLVVSVALAVGIVYVIVGRDLSHQYNVAGTDVFVPTSADEIAEGERRARILGCNGGCHGRDGSGGDIFFELPDGSRLVAPDLHRLAADYSTDQLDLAIRHGIRRNGTTVIGAMPAEMFHNLSDQHLGQIIAYLRSRPPGEKQLPVRRLGPLIRGMFVFFRVVEGWEPFAARAIDHNAMRPVYNAEDPIAVGHYLATTSCTECHGNNLEGDDSTPDLVVASSYSLEDFAHLMRTGEPTGDRELDLMARVAQSRFAYFTDREIEVLHTYLRNRAR